MIQPSNSGDSFDWSRLPAAFDTDAAERVTAEFAERHGCADPLLRKVLRSLGGNSQYLSDLALAEATEFRRIVVQGPDATCDRALAELAVTSPALSRTEMAARLRGAKRLVALAAAMADLGDLWTLEQVTGALSDLADGTLGLATAHLLHTAHLKGELRLPHPAAPSRGSGFTVLGMGKLGARELNFSSDVDLILLFDPEVHPYRADDIGAIFARLARDLVALMQQRDAGGYVFRTDLRLRPDPASTPLAVGLPAAMTYYESQAQTWERAAMIKARPVAGDLALGRRFLAAIRPFVWRKHLDFAAVSDIQAMKRRMDGHKGAALAEEGDAVTRLLGHDVKLGEGGIREVEFCAQMLQLVWGGRDPALRAAGTIQTLADLTRSAHLPASQSAELVSGYRSLRRVEHRLQMVADLQTHALPNNRADFGGFAAFMGFADPPAFATDLLTQLLGIRRIFAGLFAQPVDTPDLQQTSSAPLPNQATETSVCSTQPAPALPWDEWLAGRPRALRTDRARALLRELIPAISAAMERQPDPTLAWTRLDEFIYRLPSGVQIFSLLRHNPALLDRLGDVLGAAPSLANHLAEIPSSLEGLATPADRLDDPASGLARVLDEANSLDEALGIASRFIRGEEFGLAVAEFDLRLDIDKAARARTALAETALATLLPMVMREHERRFGRVPGGAMAIVALGKAGSQEMMAGSDLDLILIYDHPPEHTESRARRPMAASQYFARAAQAVVAALTVPTREGPLYQVDMRLRPSGNAGPVAVSLQSFRHYHNTSAWTWERLALTRARVIAGPVGLRRKVRTAIRQALQAGDRSGVLPDTASMRGRLSRDLPPKSAWDVKMRDGGLIEVEFIAQALQLVHARRRGILHPNTATALAALRDAGLLAESDADLLIRADWVWRSVQGMMRIAVGRDVTAQPPDPVIGKLSQLTEMPLGSGPLQQRLDDLARDVRASFVRLIGDGATA